MIPTIDYTKKLVAACACGRPATIAGQCNGCHEIGQYVSQIAPANPKTANLNEQLLRQKQEQDERMRNLLDGFMQDMADLEKVSEAILQAARGAGFPNARMADQPAPTQDANDLWEAETMKTREQDRPL